MKEKYPDSTFILGGPITWSLREEGKLFYLEYFDYIFIMDGEETLPMFLRAFEDASYTDLPQIIEAEARFPIQQAENIHIDLLKPKIKHYYGAVLEVSRGCLFCVNSVISGFCLETISPKTNR